MQEDKELIHNLYITKLETMVDKDMETLNEILDDEIIMTHMSWKQQSKSEFLKEIKDWILNYYWYEIKKEEINVNEDIWYIYAVVTLDAKVYWIPWTWTLSMKIDTKKSEWKWKFCGKIVTHPA